MYSFTKVDMLVGRSKAEVDMQCAYCYEETQQLGVKAEQEYFFIEGCRTYERITKDDWSRPWVEKFIPYVPYSFRERAANRRIFPERFRDRIKQHRMCLECYRKLYRFFLGDLRFPASCGQRIQVVTKHTMRMYTSMPDRTYNCQCCGVHIPGGTTYGRRGHYDTICAGCFKLLAKYIGMEFSY